MDVMRSRMLEFQRAEITEHFIYMRLASAVRDENNRKVLEQISRDEFAHYEFWKRQTGQDIPPDRWKIFYYVSIARVLGLTFGVKLMESGENKAQGNYAQMKAAIPEVEEIVKDEEAHENQLLNVLDEERLQYVSSVVLGLNDALVELTGALAGFTLALRETKLIAAVGLITGIAASMSMAASEYLSTKQEEPR